MATTSSESVQQWQTLYEKLEFDALTRALSTADGDELSVEICTMRAALARCAKAPWTDLVVACRDVPDLAADVCAAAVRACAQHRAPGLARQLVEIGLGRHPGDARLEELREQLDTGAKVDLLPARARVRGHLARGDLHEAARAAADWRERAEISWERLAATRLLAAIATESGRFDEAAQLYERAAELGGDEAPETRWAAGTCWLAAGEIARARGVLQRLRDDSREASQAALRTAHERSSSLLEHLDREAEAEPRWIGTAPDRIRPLWTGAPGTAALELLRWAFAEVGIAKPDGELGTIAHLCHALRKAAVSQRRVRLKRDRLAAALRAGAVVIIPEERPTDTGFLWLQRYDAGSDLLWLVDPREPGVCLRRCREQETRSALFGFSALLVWDPAVITLGAEELTHDADLDLLDACDLDENGNVPPRARVAFLAEQGTERCPELPMFHRRHGESLLQKLVAGDIEPGPAGEFERWLSATRERFPEAEWPLQLYALALEDQGRYPEAGIAWSDAGYEDPNDERNFVGEARAANQIGAYDAALNMLRRAAVLAPDSAEIQAQLAENAYLRDDAQGQALHADVALEMDPDNLRAQHYRAVAAEQAGELERATELFERMSNSEEAPPGPRTRLVRRYRVAARWDDAWSTASALCQSRPQDASFWQALIDLSMAMGRTTDGFQAGLVGLDRCGPEALAAPLSLLATHCFARDSGAVERLARSLLASPDHAEPLVRMLIEVRDFETGYALASRCRELLEPGLNGPWLLARVITRTPELAREHETEARELLGFLCERAGGFPYPYVLLALSLLDAGDAEQALAIISQADADRAPALVWEIGARAYSALGREAQAAALRERLPEVYPRGVLDELGFLRGMGHPQLALDLIQPLADANEGPLPGPVVNELATTLAACGQPSAATDALLELQTREPRSVARGELAESAEQARRWEVVADVARRASHDIAHNSSDDNDFWLWRGVEAGAELARGNPAVRDEFIERAPAHMSGWIELVRCERRAGHELHDTDAARLAELAPRALDRIAHQLSQRPAVGSQEN